MVLGFPVKASVLVARSADWLVGQRQRRIRRSLSNAYAEAPLKIVGGEGCHLIDATGQRWLDKVSKAAGR